MDDEADARGKEGGGGLNVGERWSARIYLMAGGCRMRRRCSRPPSPAVSGGATPAGGTGTANKDERPRPPWGRSQRGIDVLHVDVVAIRAPILLPMDVDDAVAQSGPPSERSGRTACSGVAPNINGRGCCLLRAARLCGVVR